MPELPEVETVRTAMDDALRGALISRLWQSGKTMRWPIPPRLDEMITGCRISNLERRGKYILMRLDNAMTLILHLGMSGSIRLHDQPPPHRRHDHLVLDCMTTADRRCLAILNDPRRFGGCQLVASETADSHPLLKKMGPEPFANTVSGPWLAAQLANRRTSIKAALLDQQLIAGIGNIYASEALFEAAISPRRLACNLGLARAERLVPAIRAVLQRAIRAGGTSLRDHVQPGGEIGYFAQQLQVYDRAGQPCPRCRAPLQLLRQAGRASFYCGGCQR